VSALSTASAEQRTREELEGAVAQLYMQEMQRAEIAAALNLTKGQLHKILHGLFAEGMPKRKRRCMTDKQVRAIHAAHLRGGSINKLAAAIGFTGNAARHQIRNRNLPLRKQIGPAKTPAHGEQQAITALLAGRVHALRKARGLTIEQLAHESDLPIETLKRLGEQLGGQAW
jgi:transposase-like protein